ncbi:MAG: amidase, partial [Bacillota bacterium]|nr:amidase [Bacillota bacterium]
MKKVLELNIKELAEKYRKKEISPLEVVKENYIKINKREKELNMFINLYEKEALEIAKIAEEKFVKGNYEDKNLLLGIPYGIKDLYDVKDKEMTCGSPSMKGYISKTNSVIYSNIKNKGGILLGKTNMNEFAAGYVNDFFGRTNNPINPHYTAGGSSGGSAALIGDGIGLFAFGTDTGGSIRIPGSYCGIIGLKPTKGFLSEKGIMPLSKTLDHPGYFTRNLEDLLIVLSSLKNRDIKEMINIDGDIYKGIRIGVLGEEDLKNIDEDIRQEYEKLIINIKKKKIFYIEEILLPDNNYVLDTFEKIFFPEMSYIHENLKNDKSLYRKETFDMVKKGRSIKALDYIKGLEQKENISSRFQEIFKKVD